MCALDPSYNQSCHNNSLGLQQTHMMEHSWISACGVWGGWFENTYFDVMVFNPHDPSNKNLTPMACYKRHEREKKRNILSSGASSDNPTAFAVNSCRRRRF